MREAILRQNRTHRGFKGSAAIRHRDIEVQRAALRLFIFILPDGRIWFPKWIVRDNCDLLDWLIRNLAGIGMRRKGVWAKAPINQNTKVMFAPDEPPE